MTTLTADTTPQNTETPAAVTALLDDLDVAIVEAGPATAARKCSTDNGCDTVAGSDC